MVTNGNCGKPFDLIGIFATPWSDYTHGYPIGTQWGSHRNTSGFTGALLNPMGAWELHGVLWDAHGYSL